jgi:hypothetical protein
MLPSSVALHLFAGLLPPADERTRFPSPVLVKKVGKARHDLIHG